MLKVTSILCVVLFSMFTLIQSQHADQIKDFTLPNATDGQTFSLSQYHDAKAVVLIFTSLYCPYAKLYENRILRLVDQYNSDDIRFILINPNNPSKSKADAMPNITAEAKKSQLTIPFLSDSGQEVASILGAEKTPEVFILKPKNGFFTVVYQGGIDDNPQVEIDVKHTYLQDAIEAVKQNRTLSHSSSPVTGCMIKR